MEDKKVSTLFEEMRDDISNYITSTLELGKLEVYEKISRGSAGLIFGFTIAAIALISFLFILITAALYLGELLQSGWLGFAIVAAFTILVLVILLSVKKPFKKNIINQVVSFLMKQDDNDVKKDDK